MSSVDSPDWLTAPSLGNADLVNQNQQNVPANGTYTWGPFLVAPAKSIAVIVEGLTTDPSEWEVNWSSSPTGSPLTYSVAFFKTTQTFTEFALPVIAPYVSVEVTNNGTATHPYMLTLISTQTENPTPNLLQPVILAAGVENVAANSSVTVIPAIQIPGRGKLFSQGPTATTNVLMQYWTGGQWTTYAGAPQDTNVAQMVDVDLPLSDYRLVYQNTGAAAENINGALSVSPY